MKIYLDDTATRDTMQPLSLTKNVADVRIGILTIREKWHSLGFATTKNTTEADVAIDASHIPCVATFQSIIEKKSTADYLQYPWQVFQWNHKHLLNDFQLMTDGSTSQQISSTNIVLGSGQIFIEDGAIVEASFLNAKEGPIYIGKNALVMEGAMIRGPFAACEGAVVKMGAKIYGATTIGPFSTAGGEIKNVVISGFSNKAHDGYLGDSVLGEWCNLGAGTSNSNLKNTGGVVHMQNVANGDQHNVGNKAGLVMGDYSRSAINTSFNTGTVVGVCCNVFGSQVPPKHIPSFSWGNQQYLFHKALADIENWKGFKGKALSRQEVLVLENIHKNISK